MNSIHRPIKNRKERYGTSKKSQGRFMRTARAAALAGSLAISSLMMPKANAEDAPAMVEQQCGETRDSDVPGCTIRALEAAEVTFTNGEDRTAYLVIRQRSVPEIEVDGPSEVSLRFYPALRSERFSENDRVTEEVEVSIDSESINRTESFSGVVRVSRHTGEMVSEDMITPNMIVGTPLDIVVEVDEHAQISIESSNGFLEFVGIQRIAEERDIEETEDPDTHSEEPENIEHEVSGVVAVSEDPQEDAEEADAVEEHLRQIFSLRGERMVFDRLGDSAAIDNNYSMITGNIWFNDTISLVPGAYFSTHGMELQTDESLVRMRSYSTDLIIGAGIMLDEHYLEGGALLGYRFTPFDVRFESDGSVSSNQSGEFEYGGMLRYRYSDFFETNIHASSNPANPLKANFLGRIPATWARNDNHVFYPEISLELSFLRSLRAIDSETIGATEIGDDHLYLNLAGRIPTYPIGPFIVNCDIAGDMDISGGGYQWADLFVGGSVELEHNGFVLSASGLGSPLTERYSLSLNISYSR